MPKIEIVPYSDRWPVEFGSTAALIRQALVDRALRIDHIGSTAVEGLPAKDIIDIQITVAALDDASAYVDPLAALGYNWLPDITSDHVPAGGDPDPTLWRKLFLRTPDGARRVNVHVRIDANPNQRYPLLFRDYLRAHPTAASAYAEVKRQLARYHPDDMDAYYDIKDPVCDIIMAGAEEWATATNWQPGRSDA